MPTRTSLHFVALMLSALSTGVFVGTRTSLGPSVETFSARTYVEVQQATIRNLRPVMGPLLPAAVLANLAVLAVPRSTDRTTFALNLAGLAGQSAALALTVAIELPINARVLTWSPDDSPEGWEGVRDRWGATHTIRAATSVLGLAALLGAALLPPARSR